MPAPISDGGQYTGLSDNLMKYGVVPAEVMRESYSSNNTSRMRNLSALKLREDGLELRRMYADKAKPAALQTRKEQMLGGIYRMLALTLGTPRLIYGHVRIQRECGQHSQIHANGVLQRNLQEMT